MKKLVSFSTFVLAFSTLVLSGCTKSPLKEIDSAESTQMSTSLPSATSQANLPKTCVEETLKITDPKPNQKITLPFTIDGTIETPTSTTCKRWGVFEAQAGTLEIQSEDGKVIYSQPFTIEGEWMTEKPIPFSIIITSDVLAPNEQINLVFTSDNASGLPENDQKYVLPVQIN